MSKLYNALIDLFKVNPDFKESLEEYSQNIASMSLNTLIKEYSGIVKENLVPILLIDIKDLKDNDSISCMPDYYELIELMSDKISEHKKADTVAALMDIENQVYDAFNVTCKQYGDTYIKMVLSMAQKVIESIPVEALTPDIKKELEAYNFHAVNHAIDLVLITDKYSGRQYVQED